MLTWFTLKHTEPSKINYGREKVVIFELTALASIPKSDGVQAGQSHQHHVVLLLTKEDSKRIFEALAFEEAQDGLRPPATETNIPQGRMNRRRLLRAWVEVGAWIVDFKRVHGRSDYS